MKTQRIALTALSLALLSPAFGEIQDDDIYVCGDSRYKKIQEGVNAARPGSRVHVCAGTYAEQVTIAVDGITVQADGKAIVVEPTPAQPYGFRILGQNVNVHGFSITGFKDRSLSAGILLDHARGAAIVDNVVYGNCNGVLLNQSPGANISGNNLSQNPYPISPVAQTGIPEPPPGQTPPNACVVFAYDPVTEAAIVTADGYGVKSVASREQMVKENTVSQNGECGIQLSGDSAGSTISGNTLFFNTGQQFTPCGNIDFRSVSGSEEGIEVSGNRIDNGTNGVMLTSSDRVTVENNIVTRNFQGIQLVSSNRNTFGQNKLNHNTVGIFMTGQFNEFDGNNVDTNDNQGIVVYVGGCPNPCVSKAGQSFSDTWANAFRNNSVEKNRFADVFDFSAMSGTQCTIDPGCNTNPPGPPPPPPNAPPGKYTPGTLDFWIQTDCSTSTPASICAK